VSDKKLKARKTHDGDAKPIGKEHAGKWVIKKRQKPWQVTLKGTPVKWSTNLTGQARGQGLKLPAASCRESSTVRNSDNFIFAR
jgi:hypothetical protein